MFINLYIKINVDLFLDLMVSKKNQKKLYECLIERFDKNELQR